MEQSTPLLLSFMAHLQEYGTPAIFPTSVGKGQITTWGLPMVCQTSLFDSPKTDLQRRVDPEG